MASVATMHTNEVGQAIPVDTPHAVSVSLPSWKANVGYEEGDEWVLSKMKNGYPRFFIHLSIEAFAKAIVTKYGHATEQAMLFPSTLIAQRCLDFLLQSDSVANLHGHSPMSKDVPRILDLLFRARLPKEASSHGVSTVISAVIYPPCYSKSAKTFWQHSGDGVSSRRADFCHKAFKEGHMVARHDVLRRSSAMAHTSKGPRRYQREAPREQADASPETLESHEKTDYMQFLEERFGRNLETSFTASAKLAIRRRIAGSLTADVDLQESFDVSGEAEMVRKVPGFSEDDVYLYPTGMSAIFNMHQTLLKTRGWLKSVSYGFPYIDTLKILEKWGPGCLFYGNGSSSDLDDLEARCKNGDKFLALFCEFPGNPLLKTPDLRRIRALADQFDFAVVVDETIGNFMNVHVLPAADIVVSSLTKVFSGDSNVMGGSSILNPKSRYYTALRRTLSTDYEDNYWSEDAIFMERNSRDFVRRIERINTNAEALYDVLKKSPHIKQIYYPLHSPSRHLYDAYRSPKGGYGGLLSMTFHSTAHAITFFDTIETAKGPSLGTNFTLCCPFVILAHYNELAWAAQYGAEADLIRFSVGLEDTVELVKVFERALENLDRVVGIA